MGRFRRQMPSPPRPTICKLFDSFFRVQGLELGSKLEERCKQNAPKFSFLYSNQFIMETQHTNMV